MSDPEVMDIGLGDVQLSDEECVPISRREPMASGSSRISQRPVNNPAGELEGASVENLIKALMAGGLSNSIQKIAKQQAALVVGDYTDAVASTSRRSETSAEPEAGGLARRSMMVGHEVVNHFDPADPDSHVDQWLHKIDQLGAVHGWSDYERATLMQAKLDGEARRWFHRLDEYDHSWDRWKEMLRAAFPRRRDFAERLEEMVARRKLPEEGMTAYYHAKLALCGRVKISGEDAVSCIIRGLPAELRANAQAARCPTLEVLYNSFLAGLDSYHEGDVARRVTSRFQTPQKRPFPNPPRAAEPRGLKRCFNCQKMTNHLSKDCPQAVADRCRSCGEMGHWAADCNKKRSKTVDAERRGAPGSSSNKVRILISPDNLCFRQIVYVQGKAVRAYIDTGSEQNLIHELVTRRLGLEANEEGRHQVLHGFGGGVVHSRGSVSFEMTLAESHLLVTAMVTDADMGRIELLLGQPMINSPGVTMVVRSGKTYLTTAPDLNELMECLHLEHEEGRPRVVLVEDVDLEPNSVNWVRVEVLGGVPDIQYSIGRKEFPSGRSTVIIPAGLLTERQETVKVLILGDDPVRWKKGRLISRAEACQPCRRPDTMGIHQVRVLSSKSSIDFSGVVVGDITESDKQRLFDILRRKEGCFSRGDDDLGLTNLGNMQINLTTDIPIYYRPYRLSFKEREEVREKVGTLLKAGVIRESESAYASPIVLIPKKSGEIRMCVDYRALNAITVKDRYPLPLISDQLDKLANKNLFSTLDMAQGFHQLPMHPDSVHKTAFIAPDGHYEYLRVPFGLSNSPAVFQRMINKMLGKMRYGEVLAYIDDLLIPSSDVEEGLHLLETVLDLIEQAGVKLKLAKCSFLQDHIEYLGHEISGEGIRPGKRKVEALLNFPEPRDVHGVRQFMGLASYFRKFIQGFSTLARPLTGLTKKDQAWQWNSEQRQAFSVLKEHLASRPLLAVYDSQADTEVHTDASKLGVSGILLQKGSDGRWRPVEY